MTSTVPPDISPPDRGALAPGPAQRYVDSDGSKAVKYGGLNLVHLASARPWRRKFRGYAVILKNFQHGAGTFEAALPESLPSEGL